MSGKEYSPQSEEQEEHGGEDQGKPAPAYYPPPASAPCEAPSVGYEDWNEPVSAMSYITCGKCFTVYIKGDDHEC